MATEGDLGFLKQGADPELLAAVSRLVPDMEQQLDQARQAEATAQPLINLVRRHRRSANRSRR